MLDIQPGCASEIAQSQAAFAEDDTLLRPSFNDNVGFNAHQVSFHALALVEFSDYHRCGVRELLARALQDFFPDQLRGKKTLGPIGEQIRTKQSLSVRQAFEKDIHQELQIIARERRNRQNLSEIVFLAVPIDYGQKARLGELVNLVNEQNRLRPGVLYYLKDKVLSGSERDRTIHDVEHKIHIPQGIQRGLQHSLIHAVDRFVNAGRVHEDNLPARLRENSEYPVPGSLRLLGNNGYFFSDERVQKSGFTGIRPPDECDSAGFHFGSWKEVHA